VVTNWETASDFLKSTPDPNATSYLDGWSCIISKLNPNDNDSDIIVGYTWKPDLITYHKDGTTTLRSQQDSIGYGSLRYSAITEALKRYAEVQIIYKDKQTFLVEKDPEVSPVKMQDCRSCSGFGAVDSFCYVGYCREGLFIFDKNKKLIDISCKKHSYSFKDNLHVISNELRNIHVITCIHGHTLNHRVKRGMQCSSCSGAKVKDYGSKPVMYLWNGAPITVRDGKIVKKTRLPSIIEKEVVDIVEHFSTIQERQNN